MHNGWSSTQHTIYSQIYNNYTFAHLKYLNKCTGFVKLHNIVAQNKIKSIECTTAED